MTISSSSTNWREIKDAKRSGPRPADEWWYALEPNDSDDVRTAKIRRSMQRYEERFGCPPADLPRVVYVGKTPMLAYATPVERPVIPPQSVIVESSDHAEEQRIMQLTLL